MVAGVAAITSAVPAPHAVTLSLVFVALLTSVNLRGSSPAARSPSPPTGSCWRCDAPGRVPEDRLRPRDHGGEREVRAPPDHRHRWAAHPVPRAARLRFGCTALTGVEAVSDGVQEFGPEEPKRRDHPAAHGSARHDHVRRHHSAGSRPTMSTWPRTPRRWSGSPRARRSARRSVRSRSRRSATVRCSSCCRDSRHRSWFSPPTRRSTGSPCCRRCSGATDFYLPPARAPRRQARVLEQDLALAGLSAALIVAFNANVSRLIQLYILGVFLSFTLSQAGMVRHWARRLAGQSGRSAARFAASSCSTGRARWSPGSCS